MPKPPCFPPPWCVEDPATRLELTYPEAEILATIGVVALADVTWVVGNLIDQKMSRTVGTTQPYSWVGYLTGHGWKRIEDLKSARISSKLAFFARQFYNSDLDTLFESCLRRAVEETGYELRRATQRAGLIDAVIEDEI